MQMANMQLTYDALKILGFDLEGMGAVAAELGYVQELAPARKLAQGRFIARRR
jgi:hypothetical protein